MTDAREGYGAQGRPKVSTREANAVALARLVDAQPVLVDCVPAREALGLAERCDALVIVASEQRGEVTLMHDGAFELMAQPDQLAGALRNLTLPPSRHPRGVRPIDAT